MIFGILHLLGLSMVLAYLFLRFKRWLNLIAGLMAIMVGIYFDPLAVSHPWLIWAGIKQIGRPMVDYYPLFPWFGIALLGLFAGGSLYPLGQLRFNLPDWGAVALIKGLRFLGQHSLLIYLVHQPILIGTFIVLGVGSF